MWLLKKSSGKRLEGQKTLRLALGEAAGSSRLQLVEQPQQLE
jgi:hypothetical protein